MLSTIIPRILYFRRALRAREQWSRQTLLSYQAHALAKLRAFALVRSPFYRRFHEGREDRPLQELPILTKHALMTHYDEISTDSRVRLSSLERYLSSPNSASRFDGRFWVSATSGSSGMHAIIANDQREWATIIASYARANEWAHIRASLRRRTKMAVVSSTTAWHQSARVGVTIESPLVATLRLDAGSPMEAVVVRLNAFQPEVLVAYASMVRALAEEQLSGRLRIHPRAVNSSSEVLTSETRSLAQQAWAVAPFNVYAATETGGIAAECDRHDGMHLFEDLVIPEVVDRDGKPVGPGETGHRLLVTVLFSRVLPLIRYELTDRIIVGDHPCRCGRPFSTIAGLEGRTDDELELPTPAGAVVRVHPIVVHRVMDLVPSKGWQVQQLHDRLRVLIAAPHPDLRSSQVVENLQGALMGAGASLTPIEVQVVGVIPAGASGKRPLIVRRT